MRSARTVLLGVTGSIAAYKACEIIRLLRSKGYSVVPVLTAEGERFITPLSLETLAGQKAYKDMFASPEVWDPLHISLADRVDAILIAPATANVIGKLASGICDDLLTCIVSASKAPVFIAPAMNDGMYRNPIVQENIKKLRRIGYVFIGPVKGKLACDREGIGHLAPVEEIVLALGGRL